MREYCAKCWNTTDLCLLQISWRCSGSERCQASPGSTGILLLNGYNGIRMLQLPRVEPVVQLPFPSRVSEQFICSNTKELLKRDKMTRLFWVWSYFPSCIQSSLLCWAERDILSSNWVFVQLALQKCTCFPCPAASCYETCWNKWTKLKSRGFLIHVHQSRGAQPLLVQDFGQK